MEGATVVFSSTKPMRFDATGVGAVVGPGVGVDSWAMAQMRDCS